MALVSLLIILPLLVAVLILTQRDAQQRTRLIRWASYGLVALTVLLALV